jgi:TPP-dependent pyruvate/acetoin dehydrogenase alpha subunit
MGATDLEVAFGGSAAGREDREWTEEHDPLIRWAAEIAAAGHATKEQIRELDANVCSRIDAGAQFAMDSPFPNPVTATQRIFA